MIRNGFQMLCRSFLRFAMFAATSVAAAAAPCPGSPDALGTERVLAVNAATTPHVGQEHFVTTLPLARQEVVLTFDDGPWPGPTDRILDALRHECVRATFFVLGRNAASHPKLVRREAAEGHTVAHHSFSHALLTRLRSAPQRRKSTEAWRRWKRRFSGEPDRIL